MKKATHHTISIEKDYLKFSCAHFTILDPLKRERLHGHDYYLSLEVEYPASSFVDYNLFKNQLRKICKKFDEKVILPQHSEELKIKKNKSNIEIRFQNDFFSFPEKDTLILPVSNTTLEELSHHLFKLFKESSSFKKCHVKNLTLFLENLILHILKMLL